MRRTIVIDPITRLEGHGKITVALGDDGNVVDSWLQIPELRGFEAFCQGRLAEDMPQITSRICGVCPAAHHMAATKTLDALYGVAPPPAATAIRKLFYNLFMLEDHLIHFYYLGGPDFIVGPDAPDGQRNILGVSRVVGPDITRRVLSIRKRCRDLMGVLGGKAIHPVLGLPGGVAKSVTEETRGDLRAFASDALEFAEFTMRTFNEIVLGNQAFVDMLLADSTFEQTCYMGLVNSAGEVDFYEQGLRIVDTDGSLVGEYPPDRYTEVIAEHVEGWTYGKMPYLRTRGWKGLAAGPGTSLVRVAPLARLNAASGMATPRAQEEHDHLFETLGGKPSHATLAWHWARLVEVIQAAETLVRLSEAPELTDPNVRNMDLHTPREGVGIVEAPRGTLIHHYVTDPNGVIESSNMIVATQFNLASMNLSIAKTAQALIHDGVVDDGILNRIEMAFRAYDPCLSCATHCQPGTMPLELSLLRPDGTRCARIRRNRRGHIEHGSFPG